MRIIAPTAVFRTAAKMADKHRKLGPRAQHRLDVICAVEQLTVAGCPRSAAISSRGVSRRTYYRWRAALRRGGEAALEPKSTRPRRPRRRHWTAADVNAVIAMRKRFPFMGARAVHIMLKRRGSKLSRAAVQRIVRLCLKRKWIKPVEWLRGRTKPKRRRSFARSHAQRWKYGMKARRPGQLVQVDHMSVNADGGSIKEFRAVDPVTRMMVCRPCASATSFNARRFLDAVQADMPFAVESIQVDGGSEFMAEFEGACRERGVKLFVLPPRRPQWNGRVERCNATSRLELWSLWTGGMTVAEVSPALADYQRFHNHERPHSSLGMATPMEYLQGLGNLSSGKPEPSAITGGS